MLDGLRDFTVKMVAGANVATVAFMLLVGYSDLLNPERFPAFCNAGLLFPVFLFLNLGFLIFWIVFRARYVLIPLLGFLVSFVPVRQYMPVNMKGDAPKGSIKVLSYNTLGFGNQTEDEDGVNICLSYLLEQNADIVCLQEAQPTVRDAEQIDSMLKPIYAYQDVTVHPHGGNALMLLSKYPILSKELIPYESQGNMSVAYRLNINGESVLLINNHLESTGLSKEDRQQFKKLVVGKLQVDTAEQTSKLLVVKLAEATKKRGSIEYPKLSTPTRIAASSVLDPLQNTEANPSAAPNIGSNPNTGPRTYPKQEPIENRGATSPPMNPEESVRIVRAILRIQS